MNAFHTTQCYGSVMIKSGNIYEKYETKEYNDMDNIFVRKNEKSRKLTREVVDPNSDDRNVNRKQR